MEHGPLLSMGLTLLSAHLLLLLDAKPSARSIKLDATMETIVFSFHVNLLTFVINTPIILCSCFISIRYSIGSHKNRGISLGYRSLFSNVFLKIFFVLFYLTLLVLLPFSRGFVVVSSCHRFILSFIPLCQIHVSFPFTTSPCKWSWE